ncbi:MAG: hypothetical protein ACD_47C00151G0001 [uncultured bacterium]|nr:MAG: hypothetical protein ACD_47C00151G0001 [uncultured bacterium]
MFFAAMFLASPAKNSRADTALTLISSLRSLASGLSSSTVSPFICMMAYMAETVMSRF